MSHTSYVPASRRRVRGRAVAGRPVDVGQPSSGVGDRDTVGDVLDDCVRQAGGVISIVVGDLAVRDALPMK